MATSVVVTPEIRALKDELSARWGFKVSLQQMTEFLVKYYRDHEREKDHDGTVE